jgi:thymidylate synthase (FAD)
MPLRFGEEPRTEFVNDLENIKVTLVNAPTIEELRKTIVPFALATWADHPLDAQNMTDEEADKILMEVFTGKALPTALELIGCTFLLEGISLQEVTHILRHRMASFSAECSGDKWWSHKTAVVPESVQNSPEFYERYKQCVRDSKKLYTDMIDSQNISIMDARLILPRCLETFYFMRMNMGDTLRFIASRSDVAIQPAADNVIAYQMACAVIDQYPMLADVIDIDRKSDFFIKMARTGKATNLYFPEKKNDVFEYHEDDFIYPNTREEMMRGTDPVEPTSVFEKLKKRAVTFIKCVKATN